MRILPSLILLIAAPQFLFAEPWARQIGVEEAGVYRVTWEDLGLQDTLASRRLLLTHSGNKVPLLIEDGGDKRFGPGDSLLFVAERLAGTRSWNNEYSRHNVYRLTDARRGSPQYRKQKAKTGAYDSTPRVSRHLERDTLRVRFRPSRDGASPEPWYWERLSHISKKPFRWEVDFEGADPAGIRLAIGMRGWSRQARKPAGAPPDHRLEVALNGHSIGVLEYENQEEAILRIDGLDPAVVADGTNVLTLTIPKRVPEGEEHAIVDVQLLNWIEVEHAMPALVGERQLAASIGQASVAEVEPGTIVFSPKRRVIRVDGSEPLAMKPAGVWHFTHPAAALRPSWIRDDQPSRLKWKGNGADYVMITHPVLATAASPLAEFHREQGLEVMEVDVHDIYDEFNHGIQSPDAIRDFLAYAYENWELRPRFVLLVGDASWDIHNDEAKDEYYADWTFRAGETRKFRKNRSNDYSDGQQRNLIPAYSVETYEGHAASDNAFVSVSGDDIAPDMAIGRLPVVQPDEVASIVAKLIRYSNDATVGPWRRNILWITNEQKWFQKVSDTLAHDFNGLGYSPIKVYPQPEEGDNSAHQEFLRQAFDEGQLLVHFLGHGGRYIWRTGPPDIKKNHDLFTLDDVEALTPTARLPLILSMTCYSAPFDHPTADSIGEKFLRLADRGAIGVFAASWRNSPTKAFSERLISNLLKPELTIGEAIMQAKGEERSRIMVETYNLLGDPAARLALPQIGIQLASQQSGDDIHLSGSVDGLTSGQMIIDWLDADGATVRSDQSELRSGRLEARFAAGSQAESTPVGARVYVWDVDSQKDGMGSIVFEARELASNDK